MNFVSQKKSPKKRVLVLASTFPRWKNDTTPSFILELEKRLGNDFKILILVPHYKGAKTYQEMEGIFVHRFLYFFPEKFQKLCYDGGILPNIKKNKFLIVQAGTLLFCELIAAIKIIKNNNIQLIHAHWIIPQGIIAYILKKIYKIPYIVTVHGGDIYGLQNKFLLSMKKVILENAEKITVVSSAIKSEMLYKINPGLPIDVISMGVDSSLFHPHKYNQSIKEKYQINGPFLLFVGRLAEKKGILYLLQAMPVIIKNFPEIKLFVIGEGTIESQLRQYVLKAGIGKNIIFAGPLPNQELPEYYATADIFIGPSIKTKDGDTEGLGLTFIEASFSGCVAVGTNTGGISDVIKNNETGFLVPEKNPEKIADVVIHILKNPSLLKEMKKNSRLNTVKKFDWEIITEKYKQIYLNA